MEAIVWAENIMYAHLEA